jgi:Cu/Ag efflux pump CusA
MAVLVAAVAVGGCGQGDRDEKTGTSEKTPAGKTIAEKTKKANTSEPDKTGTVAEPGKTQARDLPAVGKGPGPLVTVWLDARGYRAEEVEKAIIRPLEAAFKGLKDLRTLRSVSQEGRAMVWVEFTAGIDMASARVAVSDAVRLALEELPKDVAAPLLAPISDAGGFTMLTLSAVRDRSPMEIRTLADEAVRPRLLTVPGVHYIAVLGGSVERCWIVASPERLAAHGVTLADVARAVEKGGVDDKGGRPAAAATFAAAEEVGQVVIVSREGQPVRVRDVAKVEMSGRQRPDNAPPLKLPNDAPRAAVFLAVSRHGGARDQDFRRNLGRTIDELRQVLPPEVKLDRGVPAELAAVVPELLVRLQDRLPPGQRLQAETSEKWGTMLLPESPAPLVVKVQGDDLEKLHGLSRQLANDLRKVSGIADVGVAPLVVAEPQLRIDIDREKAAELGVTAEDVADTFETARGGRIVGQIRAAGGRQLDVVLALEEEAPAKIADVRVAGSKGGMVPLAQVTKIEAVAPGPPIYRENTLRTVLVLCRVKDRPATEVAADIRRAIDAAAGAANKLPASCTVRFEP